MLRLVVGRAVRELGCAWVWYGECKKGGSAFFVRERRTGGTGCCWVDEGLVVEKEMSD